jgi:hypothetical protein
MAESAGVAQTSLSRTETLEKSFVTAGRDVSLSTAAGAFQDGTATSRTVSGILFNPGPEFPRILPVTVAIPRTAPGEAGREYSTIVVPGFWPPVLRPESGRDGALASNQAQDASPPEWLLRLATPSDTPLDLGAEAQAGVLLPQARDACFADDSWMADPGDTGQSLSGGAAKDSGLVADAAAASAALALVLGGYWSAPRTENESRTRQRYLR